MRILVMGSGGIGGFFGAQYAKAGNAVTFVARGAHLAAMRERGLTVESELAPVRLEHVDVTSDPGSAGVVDVVMVCTKLWDVVAAARQFAPAVGPDTLVIPFQNGMESHRVLQQAFGEARVAGGTAHIPVTIKSPGVIAHTGKLAKLRVGMFDGRSDARLAAFVAAGKSAGIDIGLAENIGRAMWEKFVFLAPFASVTAVTRQPVGAWRGDPDLRATFTAAVQEAIAVANAEGAGLPPRHVDEVLKAVDALPAQARSSMMTDLLAGHRIEAPWLSGAVAQRSREHGLAAPVNATLYAALKPYVDGAPRSA
jgi:2-dehydropantoate 2-reductase